MNRLSFLVVQILLLVRFAKADDVGIDFDPSDQHAWETEYGDYPYRSYVSSPLNPPAVAKEIDSPQCHDGLYTFISPRGSAVDDKRAMVVLDDEGELVWMQETTGEPYNFNVQMYNGEPHLTYWLGDDGIGGHGEGDYYLLNASYHEVAKISALNDLRADLHTLSLTAEGTAIMSIYEEYQKDDVYIWDCLFQEIDVATNTLLYQWRASDHHSLAESFHTRGYEGFSNASHWDWFHINSVEKDRYGNYLVSGRYTHSLSYIDGQTGEIIWILGGRRNMFASDDGATDFSSQHYARFHSAEEFPKLITSQTDEKQSVTTQLISFFDNRRDDRWDTEEPSRGLLIEVRYPSVTGSEVDTHTARIVKEYLHPADVSAESQGSFQVVPSEEEGEDATVAIGWGARPLWSVFTSDGQIICDTHFGTENALHAGTVQSYRAMRYPWVAQPYTSPDAVFDESSNSVFVSWNGATEVASWGLQHNDSDDQADWIYVSVTQKDGFETEIDAGKCVTRYLRVVAFDVDEIVIGISNEMELPYQTDLSCEDIDNIPFIVSDGRAFYIAGVTLTSVGVIMVTICMTMFLILAFESWRYVAAWQKTRNHEYYRLEVDPYL